MKTTFEEFNKIIDEELSFESKSGHLITNGTSDKVKAFVDNGGISKLDISANLSYSLELIKQAKSAQTREF